MAEVLSIKAVKSGQVCINTDYLMVPRAELERTITTLQRLWARMFPSFVPSASATGIIDRPLLLLNSFEAVVLGLMTILLPYMVISIANTLLFSR